MGRFLGPSAMRPPMARRGLLHLALAAPVLLAGCRWRAPVDAAPPPPPAPARPNIELVVQSAGDLLEFSPRALSCPAGSHVRITFQHAGKYVSFMHNWVLIRPGTFDEVTKAAVLAGEEHGWLPANDPAIIAATSMCGRGQSVSVEFDAPPAGRYLYICSTPGHSESMWGVLTVTPA